MARTACTTPRFFALALAGSLALSAPSAGAPFDESTGTVPLTDAALAWGFDSLLTLPPGLELDARDRQESPIPLSRLGDRFHTDPKVAIEGKGGLLLGDPVDRLVLSLSDPKSLMGRRVEVSFWQQPRGIEASATLLWRVSGTRPWTLGMVRLQPTGRLTSDGWMELSTGPVDFALGGQIAPVLSIRVERGGGILRVNRSESTLLDALQIVDLGPAAVPAARCTPASEASACGELGVCYYGRCVDAAALVGRLPADAFRDDYLDRRIFEVSHFNGNRVIQANLPSFRQAMERARAARVPRKFWAAVNDAYEALADGHGAPPALATAERPGMGVCVHLGEADRLPPGEDGQPRKLPLVFFKDPNLAAVAHRQGGDALETVDGLPLDEWKKHVSLRHYGSPGAREVVVTPLIPAVAMRTGSVLGFVRCPQAIARERACAPNELMRVEVDYYASAGERLMGGSPGDLDEDWYACDFRYKRVAGDEPAGWYTYGAFQDEGGVRTLDFNGVPNPAWARDFVGIMQAALQPDVSLFLLDQRTGTGGVFPTVDLFAAPFLDADVPGIAEVYPVHSSELDEGTRQTFLDCASSSGGEGIIPECGGFLYYQTGKYYWNSAGTLKDAKVATLISRNVSGNDYLTRLLKMRGSERTRVFGPCPTFGAFGFVYSMPTYLYELSGGSAQVADSYVYLGTPPPQLQWESGPGVEPDEVVFQSQADLLAGRDTLIERAKEWLRQ